jgi:hypothetical protein
MPKAKETIASPLLAHQIFNNGNDNDVMNIPNTTFQTNTHFANFPL